MDEGSLFAVHRPSSIVHRRSIVHRLSSFTSAWRPLLLILSLGVGLRLGLMWMLWANGGNPLIGDEGNYVLSALPLSEGHGIPDLWLWVRAPGFIFFAAGVFALTHGSLWALNLAQIGLSAIVSLLVFGLASLTSDDPIIARRAGLWAVALVAFNPLLIWSDNFFLSEPLYILCVASLILFLAIYALRVKGDKPRAWVWLVGAGVWAGLGLLTRPNLQFFLPLVALWLLSLHRSSLLLAIGRVALLAGVTLAVVLPWSFYNMARYGHFIFVDTVGAYVLYLDNTNLAPKEVNGDLERIQNQGERQNYAFERGFEWIATHKKEFLNRTLYRVITSWSADPFTDLRYPVRDKLPGTSPWLRDGYALSASVAYLLLTVLAVGGLLLAPRSGLRALVLLYLVAYVLAIGLSNNEFRYRLPVLGITSVFGGYALARGGAFWPLRVEGKWRVHAAAATLISVAFVLLTLPLILPELSRSTEARLIEIGAANQPDPVRRAEALENVARLDRVYSAPWRTAANSWELAGRYDKAIQDGKAALQREQGDWRATYMLSLYYRHEGKHGKAASVANHVPPTFNAIMQERAWAVLDTGADPSSLIPSTIDIGGDDVGWIKGFYGEEGSDSDTPFTYRWSGNSAFMRVGAHAASRKLIVRARALPGPKGENLKVRWRIATHKAVEQAMDANWKDYTFDLPPGNTNRSIEVELSASARRPSYEDKRELAVAVDSIKAEP